MPRARSNTSPAALAADMRRVPPVRKLIFVYVLAFVVGLSPACLLAAGNTGLDPFADPRAKKGGSFTMSYGDFPKSLNWYLDNNNFTWFIFGCLYEQLIQFDSVDYSPVPGLAKSW